MCLSHTGHRVPVPDWTSRFKDRVRELTLCRALLGTMYLSHTGQAGARIDGELTLCRRLLGTVCLSQAWQAGARTVRELTLCLP